jgi:hypothetical protein
MRCVRLRSKASNTNVNGHGWCCVGNQKAIGQLKLSGEELMLFLLAVILLVAWLLGIVGTYTIGAFVHVLLVIAIVLFIVGLLSGRRRVV